MNYQLRTKGMTLIEILVAIAIVAVLLGVGVYVGKIVYDQAKERALESTFTILESALDEYKEYWGDFPDPNYGAPGLTLHSESLYEQLYKTPASRKMLEKMNASLIQDNTGAVGAPEIYDPWERVLNYLYDPAVNHYPEIVSAGPDKNFGTPDDISSREK